MKDLWRNNRGATIVEFALVALPVIVLTLGIIQTAWIVWVRNLLQTSVDAAARCGAINSTTAPCNGSNLIQTANTVFAPLSGATFTANGLSCSSDGGIGLVGTYNITIVFVVSMSVTAKSCYPVISS